MRRSILAGIFFIGILVSCDKDKFNTKPSLELKSITSKTVPANSGMRIELEFTDKEGDVSDTLYFRKIRTNQRTTTTIRDSLTFRVPDFPKETKGIIQLELDYQNYLISAVNPSLPGGGKESDSLIFKFVLKDKANNKSDTLTIDGIVIERN